jgi:hypothetical protein
LDVRKINLLGRVFVPRTAEKQTPSRTPTKSAKVRHLKGAVIGAKQKAAVSRQKFAKKKKKKEKEAVYWACKGLVQ